MTTSAGEMLVGVMGSIWALMIILIVHVIGIKLELRRIADKLEELVVRAKNDWLEENDTDANPMD
jgi:hypothetical protein